MLQSNDASSSYTGIVPINRLKYIDIPDYLLLDDKSVNNYELYLGIQDFSSNENNDLDFKKGTFILFIFISIVKK